MKQIRKKVEPRRWRHFSLTRSLPINEIHNKDLVLGPKFDPICLSPTLWSWCEVQELLIIKMSTATRDLLEVVKRRQKKDSKLNFLGYFKMTKFF